MTDKIGNGSIPLRIGRLIDATVYGGPYREFGSWEHPQPMFGVKMAEEIDAPCHVDVPTKDYCIPKVSDLQAGIVKALMAMINEENVYVGCMGGIGRTGIFLAALAKVQIEYRKSKHRAGRGDDPVLYVRKHFIPHAVETDEQEQYIADLDVSNIVSWLDATQTAMGLGGLTPAKMKITPDWLRDKIAEDDPEEIGAGLWIPEDEKIDNLAFDNFKQQWKERQCEATLEALESDSGNPDSLQTQIWKLEEKITALIENQVVGTQLFNKLQARQANQSHLIRNMEIRANKTLTKPSIRERIRTWLDEN